MDTEKAIAYVQAQGNAVERARLAAILWDEPPPEAALRELAALQKPDGGWDEVEAVRALNPPQWMMPGRIETRVWLTAFCAHVLIRFGYAEAPGTTCPTDFLLAHSDETGRLAGYLRATWIALPMLTFYPGPDPDSFH
jgi:hypothetical protein